MISYIGQTGIPIVPQHDELDSSKLKAYICCPRQYFFKYICGIQKTPNEHLIWGGAIAEGMEAMRRKMGKAPDAYPTISVLAAQAAFTEHYESRRPDEIFGIPTNSIKSKGSGLMAIQEYAKRYHNDDFKIIEPEIPFNIAISDDIVITGRLDCPFEDHLGVWAYEDKTTQRQTRAWENQWENSFQIGCYNYALDVHFPNEAMGIIVNGIILTSATKVKFKRIPSPRSKDQNEYWRDEAIRLVSDIHTDYEILHDAKPTKTTIGPCYRRGSAGGSNCSKFGCEYPDLCPLANPLPKVQEIIEGVSDTEYFIEHWSPKNRFTGMETKEEEKT